MDSASDDDYSAGIKRPAYFSAGCQRKRRKLTKPESKVTSINSSTVTQLTLDRFFNTDLVTFENVKPPPNEVKGETTLDILTEVLRYMQSSDMFTTSDQVEDILTQTVPVDVTEACDDMGKWWDLILSKLTFNSTRSKRKESHEKLLCIVSEYCVNKAEDMKTSTYLILGRCFVPVLREIVYGVGGDLDAAWRKFWKELLTLTTNTLQHCDREQIKDTGQSKFEVEIVGKPSLQDLGRAPVAADERGDGDDTHDEGSTPPDSLIKARIISKPDLIIAANIPPPGSEVLHGNASSQDICIIEVRTSRKGDSKEAEIWDTTTGTNTSDTDSVCSGKRKDTLMLDSADANTVKKDSVDVNHLTKAMNMNSRLYQLDKQHFLQLFSALKEAALNDKKLPSYRMFGLYIVMHKVYPTALNVKSKTIARKHASQNLFSSTSFLIQNSYLSEPPTRGDKNHAFNMVSGPYFNLFKRGHLRALLAYICILNKYEYQHMGQLNVHS